MASKIVKSLIYPMNWLENYTIFPPRVKCLFHNEVILIVDTLVRYFVHNASYEEYSQTSDWTFLQRKCNIYFIYLCRIKEAPLSVNRKQVVFRCKLLLIGWCVALELDRRT